MRCQVAAYSLLLFLLPASVLARTWNVTVDALGDAPTIQAGIDSSSVGDTVLAWPGTYFETIDFLGKDIVVTGALGPDSTTIDASLDSTTVALFVGGESQSCILEGFTLTGGSGLDVFQGYTRGGAVYIIESSPTVRGNRFLDNSTNMDGGAVYVWSASAPPSIFPVLEDNLFEGNASKLGGAIVLDGGDCAIRGNAFINNTAINDGGAIFTFQNGEGLPVIENNEFWDNYAGDHGGAVTIGGGPVAQGAIVRRNLFVRNEAHGLGNPRNGSGGALSLGGVEGVVENNTFVDNIGLGENSCNGGAINMDTTGPGLVIRWNIIAGSTGCGIWCDNAPQSSVYENLFWSNDAAISATCSAAWADDQIYADPIFCDAANDVYTVAEQSPALTGLNVIGAFTEPGCGVAGVPKPGVAQTAWLSPAPNPVLSQTRLYFESPTAGLGRLAVFNVLGRQVRVINAIPIGEGSNSLPLLRGNLPAGIYFIRLSAPNLDARGRMVVSGSR